MRTVVDRIDLEAIRARADAATPGPWYWAPEHPEFSDVFGEADFVLPGDTPLMQFEPSRNGAADAEFVAYARQDVPTLLAEVGRLRTELADFRDKLAALAAIEDYIGESGENAARNIRDLLAGRGEHDNDPRVQARAWGLDWADVVTAPYSPEVPSA